MTAKLLKDAMERVETWPEEAQEELAAIALDMDASFKGGLYQATAEELAGIDRGLKAAREGRFATDEEVAAVLAKYRRALAAELEPRIRAAIAAGHLPEQDAARAAAGVVGLLIESLLGPLAPQAARREDVQAVALLALRALGVVDARARGLVVQAAWPD